MQTRQPIIMRPDKYKKGLQDLVADLPQLKTMVEIGSYTGESTVIFAEQGTFSYIFAVDPWENGYDPSSMASEDVDMSIVEDEFDMTVHDYKNIIKMKMTSQEASKILGNVDFVYVDGSHLYEDVLLDAELWIPKTKYIAFHDYKPSHEGVFRAVNEVLGEPSKIYDDFSCLYDVQM